MMGMIHQITVPHVGEGVKFVQILRYTKKVGEWIDEDSDLVEIETDKATFEIPSIVSGTISRILYNPGDTVEVGTALLEISRADRQGNNIVGAGQKRKHEASQNSLKKFSLSNDKKLEKNQETLAHSLSLSSGIVIAASIERAVDLACLEDIRLTIRKISPAETPSKLAIITYASVKAMHELKKFRSQLSKDLLLKEHDACSIGIAIAQKDGTLIVPSIKFESTADIYQVKSNLDNLLRNQQDARSSYHSMSISDMSSLNVHRANPVVVYPAIATLFIGSPYYGLSHEEHPRKLFNLCLSFDHRLINGAYAAEFLNLIENNIKSLHKAITKKYMGEQQ